MGAGGSIKLGVVHAAARAKMLQEQQMRQEEEQTNDEQSDDISSQSDTESDNAEPTNDGQSERISNQSDTEAVESLTEREVIHTRTLKKYQKNYPKLATYLEDIFDSMQLLRNTVDNNSTTQENVLDVIRACSQIEPSYGVLNAKECTTLFDFVVEIEGPTVLYSFALNCFRDYYKQTENEDRSCTCFGRLRKTLIAMLNFSDNHEGFCLASAKAGVVAMCLENIKRIDQENEDWQDGHEGAETIQILDVCMGILHNISRRLRDRQWFANSDEILLYFARVSVADIAASALLCLAYLVNEETNNLISANEDLLRFIVTMLDEAWQLEDRRSHGFSAKELAEGLSHLAINDNNKKILGSQGAISALTSTLKTSSDDEERASAAKALWMLAFDDTNKEVIKQKEGTLDTLRTLHHSQDAEVQKAAAGALWEIEGKTTRNNTDNTKQVSGNHVMISYQWDAQEVLVQVKNKLQANGYRVWMDIEQMGGSTLEAMAKAVENAAVVLVCVSQRYKDSTNCRSEAEYAHELKKDIIPLMMQNNYKADGWLGIMLGTKFRIGFETKHVIDSGVKELIKQLGGRGKDVDETDGSLDAVIRPTETNVLTKQHSEPDVSSWTNDDVKKWLREIGLAQLCKKVKVEFTGQTLLELQKLREECPQYFYKCLEHTLNLKNMFHLFKFKNELEKLLRN